MNIIVCIKRVPDTATAIRVAADGSSIDSSGVKYVLNPYDEFAIEEALRLKEGSEGSNVTALTLGGPESQETLRTALAMGADEGVLLSGTPSIDGLGTAEKLAEALREREFDLLLFGKQAIDDDNLQVPAMVAELLELPCATVVVELDIEGQRAVARREVEGGHEVVEFELPAVLAVQKGLNEPRYPSLKGIMMAKKKPMQEVDAGDAESGLELLELRPPSQRAGGEVVGEGADAVPELIRKLRDDAGLL